MLIVTPPQHTARQRANLGKVDLRLDPNIPSEAAELLPATTPSKKAHWPEITIKTSLHAVLPPAFIWRVCSGFHAIQSRIFSCGARCGAVCKIPALFYLKTALPGRNF